MQVTPDTVSVSGFLSDTENPPIAPLVTAETCYNDAAVRASATLSFYLSVPLIESFSCTFCWPLLQPPRNWNENLTAFRSSVA